MDYADDGIVVKIENWLHTRQETLRDSFSGMSSISGSD